MSYEKKQKKTNTFKKMTVDLVLFDSDRFNGDDLIEVLSNVSFELININLTMKKNEIGMSGNGVSPIGFVQKFYENVAGEYVFDIAVYDKYSKILERIDNSDKEYLAISARAFINKEGKITKIIGLDLTAVQYTEEDDSE